MLDYLIVGQGLAGTLLTHALRQRQKQVMVIDELYPRASSNLAAGIINPITGRRLVKSWMIDTLLPEAASCYRQLEQYLGRQLYQQRPIIRALANPEEDNDWHARQQDPAYAPLLKTSPGAGSYQDYVFPAFKYGAIHQTAQVDVPGLIHHYRANLRENGIFVAESLDYDRVQPTEHGVSYRDLRARRMIFCEGSRALRNPFFNYLPFWPSKGEVFVVEITQVQFTELLKQGIYVVPLGEDRYWVGATNDRDYENDEPTNAGAAALYQQLKQVLKVPFRILAHNAAIRPTVKDRRPFLGSHPKWNALCIFNGLGGKGTSLGPYWSKHLVEHLEAGTPLDQKVDVARYRSLWQPTNGEVKK